MEKALTKGDLAVGRDYWVRGPDAWMIYQGLFGGTGGGRLTCQFKEKTSDLMNWVVDAEEVDRNVFNSSSENLHKAVLEGLGITGAAKPPERPAAALVRSGYVCQPLGSGWLVRPHYEDGVIATDATRHAAFTSWSEMMDWLRQGHEIVAPRPRDALDVAIDESRIKSARERLMRGPQPLKPEYADTLTRPLKEAPRADSVTIKQDTSKYAPASDGDWINWDGGEESPAGTVCVWVRFRSGLRDAFGPSCVFRWNWVGATDDIVAYRHIL